MMNAEIQPIKMEIIKMKTPTREINELLGSRELGGDEILMNDKGETDTARAIARAIVGRSGEYLGDDEQVQEEREDRQAALFADYFKVVKNLKGQWVEG